MAPHSITHRRPSAPRGFTLIEIAIVLVMVGILSAMAVTGWNRVLWHVRARGAAQEFRDAILLARSDAVTRKRHSGILIDRTGMRYKRFVHRDASTGGYDAAVDSILQDWVSFPASLVIDSLRSDWSPDPIPTTCDPSTPPLDYSSQVGNMAVVFKPDGRSWATLQVRLEIRDFPDEHFDITVLPPTGFVLLRKGN